MNLIKVQPQLMSLIIIILKKYHNCPGNMTIFECSSCSLTTEGKQAFFKVLT